MPWVSPRSKDGRTEVTFDHRGPVMVEHSADVFLELQNSCPVAWTDAHGGYWIFTGSDEVMRAARDDALFSSAHDDDLRGGTNIPPMKNWAGIIEMDPPESTALRKAVVPWFTRKAAEARRPLIEMIVDHTIDGIIELGRADFALDLAAPIPALATMQFMGFPFSEAAGLSAMFHEFSYVKRGTPDADRITAQVAELEQEIQRRALAARANPTPDFLSFLANLRIDGELLSLEAIGSHGFLVLIGGIDTSSSLLTNTLLHLARHPELKERLTGPPDTLERPFHEFLRHYTPVPNLARTVTADCPVGGEQLRENDRVLLSWAAANLSPKLFRDPEQLDLDRFPNRHLSFGVGVHRCLGANLAEVIWTTAVPRILERIPDFEIDFERCIRYPDVGTANGWISTPATFTSGGKVGAVLSQELGLDVSRHASELAQASASEEMS